MSSGLKENKEHHRTKGFSRQVREEALQTFKTELEYKMISRAMNEEEGAAANLQKKNLPSNLTERVRRSLLGEASKRSMVTAEKLENL